MAKYAYMSIITKEEVPRNYLGGVSKSMLSLYPPHVNIKESQIKRFQVIA
jgi:hypothetical protein